MVAIPVFLLYPSSAFPLSLQDPFVAGISLRNVAVTITVTHFTSSHTGGSIGPLKKKASTKRVQSIGASDWGPADFTGKKEVASLCKPPS